MKAAFLQTELTAKNALLAAALEQAHQDNALLQKALEQARQENKILREKLAALLRQLFGRKSEQLDATQLELLLLGLGDTVVDVPALTPPPLPAAKTTQRICVPDHLEAQREVIDPDVVLNQPGQWKRLGEEVSRRLDYQPGQFFWQETVRPKYARIEQRDVPPVIAPMSPQVAEHILATPGLLGFLFVSKYCDHLPFYRLKKILQQRHGVFIGRMDTRFLLLG